MWSVSLTRLGDEQGAHYELGKDSQVCTVCTSLSVAK